MSQPSVAVCIVTFNSAKDIEACLLAVKHQSWGNLKTIVVDNASVDQTVEVVRNSAVEVNLISNSDNKGFAAAQNQAIGIAGDSDYVLVLNPDVILDTDYVRRLVERMVSDSRIGSVTGCLTLASNPQLIDSAGLNMNSARKAVERGAGESAAQYTEPCEVFGVSGAAAMYSRRMITGVSIDGQFYDEDFFAYKEDVDVAWRANLLGWKAWYEPLAKASHVRQWGTRSNRKRIPLKVRRHSYQNRYLMIVKNERFNFRWWMSLPKLFAHEIALNGYLLLRDPKVLVGSWMNLIRLLPYAWDKRKEIKIKSKNQ